MSLQSRSSVMKTRHGVSSSSLIPSFSLFSFPIFLLLLVSLSSVTAQTYYCNSTSPCYNGACCGYSYGEGICGFGPDFCGDTCISNCTATAQCGEYASDPTASCPLDVCCSQYGFCGTTSDFCEDGCQGDNCGYPSSPLCTSNDVLKRVIGYYESWASGRSCDSWSPSDIAASSLTHINYAFALFQPSSDGDGWVIEFMTDGVNEVDELVQQFVDLKEVNSALSCYISIGGWSFSDPPTATYWSDMASTSAGRESFAKGVLELLTTWGFDGVDLDWEYPAADDRGGKTEDTENYVKLIETLREVLDASGQAYGISFTTPSSYWYLQYFDVPAMLTAGADWTNVMTYDLHGVWDGSDPWIGAIMQAHTNLTEIKNTMELFWRIGVDPSQINLGAAFYGRSFTASDSDCVVPGCPFSGPGDAGPCTDSAGTLSYKEILEAISVNNGEIMYDETDAIYYATWSDNQWVSFDLNTSFQQKLDYANEVCLGGVMIWSVDQDSYDWEALAALLDTDVDDNNLLSGGSLSDSDAEALATKYSAFTGTSCYVSDCVDWNTGQCKSGYSVLDYVHDGFKGMIGDPDDDLCKSGKEGDEDAQYRLICCPTNAMPEGCTWEGMSDDGFCTGGSGTCGTGKYELIKDVFTDRTGDTFCMTAYRSLCCNTDAELDLCNWSGCGNENPELKGYVFDTISPFPDLDQSTIMCEGAYVSYFVCPSNDTYTGCDWYGCEDTCPDTKVLITQRDHIDSMHHGTYSNCVTGTNKLCCDPPDGANSAPVDPKNLFEYPDEEDVSYYYSIEESSNDQSGDDSTSDPFAFVMIDGDPESYSEALVDQWTFLTDEDELTKRDLKLHRRSTIFEARNDTFDNVVEKYHIQCTWLFEGESGCDDIFQGGPSNTIVKMPKDVGAGPYARVISLVPWKSTGSLKPRSTDETYELTVDYDLPAAAEEKKGDVNFRIDYTNLLDYWEEITSAPASSRKRWFGSFDDWLAKMTTVVKDEQGSLPLDYQETIKLFHAHEFCPTYNIDATFDIDANIQLGLYAQYGYYFEGSILPTPTLISSYGYFSIEPAAAILMTIRAKAVMQSNSDTIELISATFPGMSIKGLISIGPELVLTGSLDASLSLYGEVNMGVSVGWPRTEIYFPQDSAAVRDSTAPKDLSEDDPQTYSFEPTFNGELTAEGNLALTLTPEVRFGISVLGGQLMSGYVTAGVTNVVTLGVNASATVDMNGAASAGFCYWADYEYKIFLRADMSFLDDVAYWGDQLDVASPADPLVLVEETCTTYSTTNAFGKRESVGDDFTVTNGTGSGCFGGLIACSTVAESDNSTCTPDSSDAATAKRAYSCNTWPALWYNCNYFPNQAITNYNEATKAAEPFRTFTGICQNIRTYLQNNLGGNVHSNWMWLHYLSSWEAEDIGNRDEACGTDSSGMTAQCAREKRELWPQAVQTAWRDQNIPGTQDYTLMFGYTDSVSCDEFPFNGADEGGEGAQTACVPVPQQNFQGQINGLLGHIWDVQADRQWMDSGLVEWDGLDRAYTFSLVYPSVASTGDQLGAMAGAYSITNALGIARILGGVNLFGNPDFAFRGEANNAVCHIDGAGLVWYPAQGRESIRVTPCQVTYVDPANGVTAKRDFDPSDPSNYVVKEVRLSDNWEESAITIPMDDDGTALEDAFFRQFGQLGNKEDGDSDVGLSPSLSPVSRELHLEKHRHGGISGHKRSH
ncbi:hypothetical protein N7488_006334 [Penicillium malachiteum]|nr:hypothetical protein N7488_006334 [Penicillium malachiteum]